ncbi:MAG: GDP-mannose 4,6-dehydratase [Deltaproteobacteria bacterium]|nr:GDP-mannose 4,6-dehydratase [Deltaproteobacteria bacterium]MCB9488373.1 GDP-mannose 4,6-dehydratase [Deltaproteobacteria bacterium]
MRALVTGAAGFAGSHLVDHLLAEGDEIGALVLPSDKLLPEHRDRVRRFDGDIVRLEDAEAAIGEFQPEVVYHLAGIAFVPLGATPPAVMLNVNLNGTLNMLEALRRHATEAKFVFAGSAEVYGAKPETAYPLSETATPSPTSLYAHAKLFAEQSIAWYGREFGVRSVTLRLFNHIGPRQSRQFAIASFAEQLREIRAGRREAVLHVGNLEARRDFTDVRDVARAYRLVGSRETRHPFYHVASGNALTIHEVLNRMISLADIDVEIRRDPDRLRPSDVPLYLGSFERIQSELGWAPEIPLERTLRDLLGGQQDS